MPPLPKPAHLRQRRNKVPTEVTLPTAESALSNEVPELPGRKEGWRPEVLDWWSSVWRSPMASEYLAADIKGGLYLLADLHQARWEARDAPKALTTLAAEIRLQEVRFGLSPIDRSRLRWTIDQGEAAAEKTEARREKKSVPKGKDPRASLRMVG